MIHSLHIGINNYSGTGSDLYGCVNDARDWASIFGASTPYTKLLLDKAATRVSILRYVEDLMAALGPGDLGVVTYSGHGTWIPDLNNDEKDGRDECWVPYDWDNLISDDELYQLWRRRNSKSKLLLITDSCMNGTVYRMLPTTAIMNGRKPAAGSQRVRFLNPLVIRNRNPARRSSVTSMLQQVAAMPRKVKNPLERLPNGMLHLAGSADDEYCWDARINGRNNGAFTAYAIASLKSLVDGATFQDWYRDILDFLPTADFPQRPQFHAGRANAKMEIPF